MEQDQLDRYDETRGLQVEAVGLNKWVRKDLNLLQDISLFFQPREFIVVVGQSGGGKSTLVDAIAGYRPATHGTGAGQWHRCLPKFRCHPQRDRLCAAKRYHPHGLTVYQALDYAAQLRMPADTTKEERHKRIMEVLEDLDLVHRKDVQISGLSGGQQKRVSIGVELLTTPGLFFLDEPTSGLDPGTETAFMHLMRRLADQGRTIIWSPMPPRTSCWPTRWSSWRAAATWPGLARRMRPWRTSTRYRSERERRAREMEFDQIYAILDDPAKGSARNGPSATRKAPSTRNTSSKPLQNPAPGHSNASLQRLLRPARLRREAQTQAHGLGAAPVPGPLSPQPEHPDARPFQPDR